MKRCIIIFSFGLLMSTSFGQNNFKPDEAYQKHSARAYRLYDQQKYKESALSYDSLFNITGGRGTRTDKYNAACSWARAGNREKAFAYLNRAVVEDRWTNLSHILTDIDLKKLHTDKRWQPLMDIVSTNKEKIEAAYNRQLVGLLDTVYQEDQAGRATIAEVQKKYGWQSPQMDSLWRKINAKDSVNLMKVKLIIDTYGWLGPEIVGQQGATTIFLVVQHADSATQVKYLPKMREAVNNGKAEASQLALLEDRILTNQGKEQIYGSQVKTSPSGKNEFYPILDEPNVNKRRASVGLNPLEEYAKFFGIDYILPAAKK